MESQVWQGQLLEKRGSPTAPQRGRVVPKVAAVTKARGGSELGLEPTWGERSLNWDGRRQDLKQIQQW